MGEHTKPSDITRAEETRDAGQPHVAGDEPTAEEAAAAERNLVDPETREAYKEAVQRGARQQGEGKPGV
jgi:hypothetical protein